MLSRILQDMEPRVAFLFALIKVATWFSPFVWYFEKYLFSDWQFAIFFAVIILVNTALGFVRHLITKTDKTKAATDFLVKIFLYCCLMVVTHVLKNFQVNGNPSFLLQWVDVFIYSAVICNEAVRAMRNIHAIDPKLLPLSIMKKFEGITRGELEKLADGTPAPSKNESV